MGLVQAAAAECGFPLFGLAAGNKECQDLRQKLSDLANGAFLSKEHITAMTLIVRRRGKLSAPKLRYPKAGLMQGSEYEGEWQMTRSWIWTW